MILRKISHDVPTCPDSSQTGVDLSMFPNTDDNVLDTCDVISGPDITHTEVIWRFPMYKSGINSFLVVFSGFQNCSDENTAWFMSAETPSGVTECRVSQNTIGESNRCLITCKHPCDDCEYLNFHVQMPTWRRQTLVICHYELLTEYDDTVELPFVIV